MKMRVYYLIQTELMQDIIYNGRSVSQHKIVSTIEIVNLHKKNVRLSPKTKPTICVMTPVRFFDNMSPLFM